MDLNNLPKRPTQRLRAIRLKPEQTQELLELPDPTLAVFDGGEALPESEGFDTELPLSPEEQEALGVVDEASYERAAQGDGMVAQAMDEYFAKMRGELLHTNDIALAPTDYAVRSKVEHQVKGKRHVCFVTPCTWYLIVPPVPPDLGSLLGGTSVAALEQAREVEEMLTEHLSTHTLFEWASALRMAQAKAAEAEAPRIQTGFLTDPTGGDPLPVSFVAPEGVIPGPARRDPARQAAVDALDRRLGRSRPPTTPGEAINQDNALRAARAARRARQPSPYDLTPKYTANIGEGVVGIRT